MSDSLATRDILVTPSEGQAAQANGEGLGASGGQTSNNGQPAQDENIRKLQSTYDKKLSEQQRGFQQREQALQQQVNAMQNELRNMRYNSAPDDYARKELELEDLRKERDQWAAYAKQLNETQQEKADRAKAIRDILEDFDLVTEKELDDAIYEANTTSFQAAYKIATKLQREKEQRKQQVADDKAERNRPDWGSGAPHTVASDIQEKYDVARKAYDIKGQLDAMALADKRGVSIKEW